MRCILALLLVPFGTWWSPSWILSTAVSIEEDGSASTTTESSSNTVRRTKHLDYWDSDTLAYYLDQYPGYDAAVLFYAPWDSNSVALAPYWDRIATILEAGSSQSRIIMAVYDCELNKAHMELCAALSVTRYPTMMFLGPGPFYDTDPITRTIFGKKRSAGMMGDAPVATTVKFQGNWQYGDAVLDWIRTMQALSNWHLWSTQGLGRRLRNLLLWPLVRKAPNLPLPIGVPSVKSSSSSTSEAAAVKRLEKQIDQLTNRTEEYERVVLRSSTMLDALLIPSALSNSSKANAPADMFTWLQEQQAWPGQSSSTTNQAQVVQACVAELSLDYCQRISAPVASIMVEEWSAMGVSTEELLEMPDLEQQILDRIGQLEPYCILLDGCLASKFAEPQCRPATCPFEAKNPMACRYLTSCWDVSIQQEYADVLGLSLKDGVSPNDGTSSSTGPSKKRGWF